MVVASRVREWWRARAGGIREKEGMTDSAL